MILRLAERLEVPLRARNVLLLAAGYAPAFRERPLQDPAMAGAREAVDLLLAAHEPFPALAELLRELRDYVAPRPGPPTEGAANHAAVLRITSPRPD